MDFVWQRDPFRTGFQMKRTPSGGFTVEKIDRGDNRVDEAGNETRLESPGVDFLLACRMANYIGVL